MSTDSTVHQDPSAIDRTRYRVAIGEVGRFDRAVREYGPLHVAGTDSLHSAYAWMAERLAGYTSERDGNRSSWGARAAVLDVNQHRETVTLMHSLHGYPAQLHTQVTQLMSGETTGVTDLGHPYRARFYNAEDRYTAESPPFSSEAAARMWLSDKAETYLSDGVEAAITRLDPTNGWPRPILELGREPDGWLFGATVSNDLTDLTDAEAASFLSFSFTQHEDLIAPLIDAYHDADKTVHEQRSAHDRFLATVYRDRLLHLLHSAADERTAGFGHDHGVEFPLPDSYQVLDLSGEQPNWIDAFVHQLDRDRADALRPSEQFVFRDHDDRSRVIEVTWHPEHTGSDRRGWYATESVDTPDGPHFVAMLGRRETAVQILDMLADRMIGFASTQPVQRPAVNVPQDHWQAILAVGLRQRRFTGQAEAVAQQADTLRRPLGTVPGQLDNPGEAGPRNDATPPFDFWRDGVFPGMHVDNVAYNPAVWDLADNGTLTRKGIGAHTHGGENTDNGRRITRLLDAAIRDRDRTSETKPARTADPVAEDTITIALDQQQPETGHELG
ncbi:hypothetical protein [Nocardia miyunensis]|uniref:hypothetical protein n=1 Tax=Nocardia miyunensis TaxID=282684 RepID=UPI000830FE61|nr:hypothetical protein [Nocardia miyunensis]